jgi:hypothetical protein
LVASLVILMLAAGTTAPEESRTVPVMVARSDCARMRPAPNIAINIKTAEQLRILDMESLLTRFVPVGKR